MTIITDGNRPSNIKEAEEEKCLPGVLSMLLGDGTLVGMLPGCRGDGTICGVGEVIMDMGDPTEV
ncbi:hypothetical protein DPMN_011769 [Dreissena polymorpha]|uniref:Uncharacterized protein n=1 Tax=Dreissena polymorpha TaxID=45954 RepID=A0A9D4N294_DREPO|nr:hypothetical protein DPMN_011769 [Dreissena polymorpha]